MYSQSALYSGLLHLYHRLWTGENQVCLLTFLIQQTTNHKNFLHSLLSKHWRQTAVELVCWAKYVHAKVTVTDDKGDS